MISYKIFSPSGNITALVDNAVAKNQQAAVASEILKNDQSIEQVGFISYSTDAKCAFTLDMMGDEFCANGARSAAFYWMYKNNTSSCTFKMSGLSGFLTATLSGESVSLRIPSTILLQKKTVSEGTLVDLSGIRLLVTTDSSFLDRIEEVLQKYAVPLVPAIGLIYVEKKNSVLSIMPWVRVENTQSLMRESSCGSGSIAACVAEGHETGQKIDVLQPSGDALTITFTDEVEGSFIYLEGTVSYLGEKPLPFN